MKRRSVVSVDLAQKRVRDVGVCVLTQRGASVDAELVSLADAPGAGDPPSATWLAHACADLAESRGAALILIDGSQAWKDPANGHAHARACEVALHTPAKTGEPGCVKPRPYTDFIAFSVAVFDALHERGWPRLASAAVPQRRTVEAFPHAAWKRLGLAPLPAKAKCTPDRLESAHAALRARANLRTNRPPTHDELQAAIAGLPGLALLAGDATRYDLLGTPPFLLDSHWREGFILTPRPTARASALHAHAHEHAHESAGASRGPGAE